MKRFQLIFTKLLPYSAVFALLFAIMFFGSQNKQESVSASTLLGADSDSRTITIDQVDGAYTTANIAVAAGLPSSTTALNNYISASNIYNETGVVSDATTIVEKRTILDTSMLSRGVISYVVQEGDTLDSIIAEHNLSASKDQIRWSNGLKNEDVSTGTTLLLPSTAGIVYTVKDGDELEKLAEKYSSSLAELIAFNDLEEQNLSTGMRLVLPNGNLPETERPEYVAPVTTTTYIRSYASATRKNVIEVNDRNWYTEPSVGNRNVRGQCTWYAWWWRNTFMPSNYHLPSRALGNARDWVSSLSGEYTINNTPAYGAVFHTYGGSWYGHVGVVVGVSEGDSIRVREMNQFGAYNATESTISWSEALQLNYIHGRK